MNESVGRLARLGFLDAGRAEMLLGHIPELDSRSAAIATLARTADPDQGLLMLGRVLDAADPQTRVQLLASLEQDSNLRERLLAVLGLSQALGDHLVRHPGDWATLSGDPVDPAQDARADILRAVGADPTADQPVARDASQQTLIDLRVVYRRRLLRLASADLVDGMAFYRVGRVLADLADATLEAGLAIARSAVDDAGACRLAVIAMGKCGARELNYISDVDVIFVAEPADGVDEERALKVGTRLATELMRAANAATPEGTIWEVDPNLRPEGKNGALVRTLNSHLEYYRRWASTWEFQALLKARAAAGDCALGEAYVEAVSEFIWTAADRDNFVEDVQAMRRRVERSASGKKADRQLKLGPGGLRDVEFSVQLLQMVHGRSDVMLRTPNTLEALQSLATWGYVGRHDASDLSAAYHFLRTMEHRLQMYRFKRTHVVPTAPADLRRLGRSMGFTTDPEAELTAAWKAHAVVARRLHEKLFYRPLLKAVARLDAGEARLSHEAAGDRLRALGFADPDGALRHMEALTVGVSRRAAIQRTLLPVMLGWFADTPNPDMGLFGFRKLSESLGSAPWFLGLLRDQSVVAERLATVLGTSRFASDLILRAPEAVDMLADPEALKPRGRESLLVEARSAADRYGRPDNGAAALRAMRRRELLRAATADIALQPEAEVVGAALTDVARATLEGALEIAQSSLESQNERPVRARMSIVAMGRFGGGELGYGSDADVLFVFEPVAGEDSAAAGRDALALANELRRLLTIPSSEPPLEIDADLRPEGRSGPLVRSLASYGAYYGRWSAPWEAQALLRAEPVAGDKDLGARFVELIDPLRYPSGGIDAHAEREVRRLKARMEAERLPRGADPSLHTKLGRGGLSDVEWTVQLLQLQHAADVPGLRTTRTLQAMAAAEQAGLIAADDAELLAQAWRLATRMRNAIMLVRGRPSDSVPTDLQALSAVGRVLGHSADEPVSDLVEEYLRVTRRARHVVDTVFYGHDDEVWG